MLLRNRFISFSMQASASEIHERTTFACGKSFGSHPLWTNLKTDQMVDS